jgi:MauM/NapG family ferredoxin protein
MERRGLLSAALAAIAGLAIGLRGRSRSVSVLRPPTANSEFEARCIRCFRCAEVCPPKAIRFESSLSLASSDLPYIDATERGCTLCMKCTQACPTGALIPTVADSRIVHKAVKMGAPVLTRDRCISWRGLGVCRLCYYVCPYPNDAVSLVGPNQSPLFDATLCVGCGLCEEACPSIARAIRILPTSASVIT